MKIVILNTSESTGGAAIACKRLMVALQKKGIEIKMLVRDKQTGNESIVCINRNKYIKILNTLRFLWERFVIWTHNRFSKNNLFTVSLANTGNNIYREKEIKEADIIHIHWINQGFLSLQDLKRLAGLKKPIIWTMHDQWAYTGICHYAGGCDQFTDRCSHCPRLTHPGKHDLSYQIFKKKEELYQSKAFTFVGCSRWIAHEAKKRSRLCKDANVVSIPNPIDIDIYTKKNKNNARELFGLPLNKKLILFGASKVTDERKGFDYMRTSCNRLFEQKRYAQEEIQIVIFGGKTGGIETLLPYPVHNAGYINAVHTMVNLYNAVDLFLIPSLEDNLPNTIMEALACGTPCVGFNVGGIPEMIDHKINGYVAEYKNAEDLADGINWVLNEANYNELATHARKKVENCYSEEVVAKQYISLYQQFL
jgi:glycosyltransferase involved in cell wall biosynthesis